MARIRTIKPEAFTSESLAQVSVTAERTFFGLLTQADDQGRHRDHAAIIAGLLWPLRPEHTPVHVEDDLQQLQDAGLICRYTGCDGRGYLHVVTWAKHQKIDRPSQSRLPVCPVHQAEQRCGVCRSTCTTATDRPVEDAPNPRRVLDEDAPYPPRALDAPSTPPADTPATHEPSSPNALVEPAEPPGSRVREAAVSAVGVEPSVKARRGFAEGSASGSGTVDLGSSVPTERGASAPAPPASAQQLIAGYVAGCAHRPPGKVLGHLGREISQLLAEGIDPVHIRAGLERFRSKPMHPSVLPSLVNEAMNTTGGGLVRPGSPPSVPGHRAWTNPVDAAAYAEEL